MKKIFILLVALGALGFGGRALAEQLLYDYSYKGIVKIYTYYEDDSYYLSAAKTGSGVIIDSNGTILTNEHVVTIKDTMDNEVPVVFKVCLTEDYTVEPKCNYTAELVAKDENKDIALIKIKNVDYNSKPSYDYLAFAESAAVTNNKSVTSLGYPGSGGDTITVSQGTILGTTDKFGVSWIKTDALVSFGSSGGALIDTQGKLLGITSAANSDLGYVININSVRSWIGQNAGKTPQSSKYQSRLASLMAKQNQLKESNNFTYAFPKINFIKPDTWEYRYDSENIISAFNPDIENGGFIIIRWQPDEILVDGNYLQTVTELLQVQNNCFSAGAASLPGLAGIKFVCPADGEEIPMMIFGVKNYVVFVTYFYGKEKVDQFAVDTTFQRLNISAEGVSYSEQKNYEHADPYFKISLPDDWSLKGRNSSGIPLTGTNKNDPHQSFIVFTGKLTDSQISMDNQSYYNYIKDIDIAETYTEESLGLKGVRYYETADYKLNNELAHIIFNKYKFKDEDDSDKIKYYTAGFRIKNNNKVVILVYDYFGSDEQKFEAALKDFEQRVLSSFTLGLKVTAPIAEPPVPAPLTAVETPPASELSASAPAAQATPAAQPADSGAEIIKTVVAKVQAIKNLGRRFIGRILLRVENRGEAWYLSPKTGQAHYLANGAAAYQLMREQGMGISNKDLAKIPVGLSDLSGADTDADGLTDALEQALGTNPEQADTDGDGHNDKAEIETGYDPLKAKVRMVYNNALTNRFRGRILLQVENRGQAWYINPKDGKRYFLGTAEDAYQVMRKQSLGIAERDFAKL